MFKTPMDLEERDSGSNKLKIRWRESYRITTNKMSCRWQKQKKKKNKSVSAVSDFILQRDLQQRAFI